MTARDWYTMSIDEPLGHPGHTLTLIAHRDGVDGRGVGRWVNEYHCDECGVVVELRND